ncbi:MAG: DUF2541 domain-containing protein [Hyphomicrobiaceae bacterium]
MYLRLLAFSLVLFAFGQTAAATAQVEVTLAEEKAGRVIPDVDRIDVRAIPGKFSGIRVYALDGSAVDITTIDIEYADGSKFTEDRGRLIRLNTRDVRTRVMGPDNGRGPEKFIDSIVMHYKAAPGQPRAARVRVTGITSRSGAKAIRPRESVSGDQGNAPPPPVVAGGDLLFGVQQVGFGVDRDIIKVGHDYGKFDKIRLRVLDNDIFINQMRIIYSEGDSDVLDVNAEVRANTRSRWFTLKGDRFIKEIQLVYRSRPKFKGQARIEVYGEYAEGWYDTTSAAASAQTAAANEAFKFSGNRGWLFLGGQEPKFFSLSLKRGIGYETDTISVARNWGFNRLRLDVKDRAIQLNKLILVYGDGTSETIKVGKKVEGGAYYGPVELKRKPVKELKVSYRSRVFDRYATTRSHAFVEFWAQ